jgi:hypothetical protein
MSRRSTTADRRPESSSPQGGRCTGHEASRGRRIAGWTVLTVLVVTAGLLTWGSTRHHPVTNGGCPSPPPADRVPVGRTVASTGPRPSATLRVGQRTRLDFGRAQSAKDLVLYFDVNGDLPKAHQLAVRVDPFRRDDDARLHQKVSNPTATDDDVAASALVRGREVEALVCFGREGDELGDPGLYAGSITLTDPRLSSEVTVPVTVTLQYVHGVILLWLLLPVVVPGVWLLWVTKTAATNRHYAFDGRSMFSWLRTVGGVVSVTTGVVAAFSVYVGTYLLDDTWGSGPYQVLSLYGAMFSAFVATAGIAHAGAQAIGASPNHSQPEPQRDEDDGNESGDPPTQPPEDPNRADPRRS